MGQRPWKKRCESTDTMSESNNQTNPGERMSLTEGDKREIKEIFFDVINEHYHNHGFSVASHARDHEFIEQWRCNTQAVRKAGLWTATAGIVSGLLALLWTLIAKGG